MKKKIVFYFQMDSGQFSANVKEKFTAIIEKSENGWYVGQVKEMPAAISQEKTVDELLSNLSDAILLISQINIDQH